MKFINKKIKNQLLRYFIYLFASIFIAIILSLNFFRIDLTSEGRFSLSDYTKNTLENLEDEIYITIYLDGDDLPVNFKKLRQAIKEELDEFQAYAGDNVNYKFVNPTENPNQNEKKALQEYLYENRIFPVRIRETDSNEKTIEKDVYPGAIISSAGKKQTIDFIQKTLGTQTGSEENINNSIQALEYELINAIQKIQKKNKPKIAFIEGHNEINRYELSSVTAMLMEYYMVDFIKLNNDLKLNEKYKTLIVAGPKTEFSEQDKLVIDRFIMNGGSVLWMVEGTNTNIDSLLYSSYTIAMGQDLNINEQLFNYGARVNHNLVLDKQSSPIGIPDERGKIQPYPWFYFPVILSDNNHPVSKYLDVIRTEFLCSVDTVGEDMSVRKTVLLKTSELSRLVDAPMRIELRHAASMPDDIYLTSGRQNVAVLLEGNFKSLYKERNVNSIIDGASQNQTDKSKTTKMIVVGDADIIRNGLDSDGKPYKVGFDYRFSHNYFAGNGEFILNSVNYLCDDDGLMSLRSRELKLRLLDRDKIVKNRLLIQLINVAFPVLLVLLSGLIIVILRRKKYRI